MPVNTPADALAAADLLATPPTSHDDATVLGPDAGPARGLYPTTKVVFRGNLRLGAVHVWDVASPAATSNFSFSLDIIDKSGSSVWMPVYFALEAAPSTYGFGSAWGYHAEVGGALIQSGVDCELLEGSLVFDDRGSLFEARQRTTDIPLKDGDVQTIVLDFGTGTSQGGAGDTITATDRDSFMTVLSRQPDI